MPKTKEEIIANIKDQIDSEKGSYDSWYIGTTNDADKRLFSPTEHNVDQNNGWWIYRSANSKEIAEEIAKYFINLGLKGSTVSISDNSNIVYAFKISPLTKQ